MSESVTVKVAGGLVTLHDFAGESEAPGRDSGSNSAESESYNRDVALPVALPGIQFPSTEVGTGYRLPVGPLAAGY